MIIVFFQDMKFVLHFQTSKRHSFITITVNDINNISQDSGKALRPNSGGLSKCEPYTLPYHHRYLQKCSKFFNRWGSSYRKFRTDHESLKSIKTIAVRFHNVLHGELIVMFLNLWLFCTFNILGILKILSRSFNWSICTVLVWTQDLRQLLHMRIAYRII